MSKDREVAQAIVERFSGKFDHKLLQVTPTDRLPKNLASVLVPLYASNELNKRLLACLINGVYTEGTLDFLFSLPLMQKLISNDNAIKERRACATLSSQEFKTFKAFLTKHAVITVVEDSKAIDAKESRGRAAKCELIDADFVPLLKNAKKMKQGSFRITHKPKANTAPGGELPDSPVKAAPKTFASAKSEVLDRLKRLKIENKLYLRCVSKSPEDIKDRVKRLILKNDFETALKILRDYEKSRDEVYENRLRRGLETLSLSQAVRNLNRK